MRNRFIPSSVGRVAILFLAVAVLCVAVLGILFVDLRLGELTDGSETSATEFAQCFLVGAISVALFAAAVRRSDLRGGVILFAGFFLCLSIRENDSWLDGICHGFWFPLALAATFVCLVLAWRFRDSLRPGLDAMCNFRTAAFLVVGLALLLVFSRLFGSKAFWRVAGLYQYSHAVKTISEEAVELLADAFLGLWAFLTLLKLHPSSR